MIEEETVQRATDRGNSKASRSAVSVVELCQQAGFAERTLYLYGLLRILQEEYLRVADKGGCTPVSGVSRDDSFSLCAPIGHPHEHASTAGRPLRATIEIGFRVCRSNEGCHCLDYLRNR